MPKHFRSLNQVKINTPCNADWDLMQGNDQVRFCEHCNLHVTNLSSITRTEAMRVVAEARGRICVRYIVAPSGGVFTPKMPEKLYRIARRTTRMAAGAFSATLSLSTAAAQTRPSPPAQPSPVELIETSCVRVKAAEDFSAGVSGKIQSSEGDLIANATVMLV